MAPRVTQVRASPGRRRVGPDGGTWEAGERVRRQVGTTLSSIAWSIREQAHGSGIRMESGAARGRRPSAEPLVAGVGRLQRISGVGRAGGLRRGRCKYVHVSSVAACSCAQSCTRGKARVGRPAQPARAMPRAHAAHAPAQPTRPATDRFLRGQPRKAEQKSKAEAGRCALKCLTSDVPLLPASGRHYREHPRMAWIYRRSRKSVGGGWVRWRGVRGMDAAAKPPGTGLRRPRHRTHPAIPREPRFCFGRCRCCCCCCCPGLGGCRAPPGQSPSPLPVQCRARFPTTVPRT